MTSNRHNAASGSRATPCLHRNTFIDNTARSSAAPSITTSFQPRRDAACQLARCAHCQREACSHASPNLYVHMTSCSIKKIAAEQHGDDAPATGSKAFLRNMPHSRLVVVGAVHAQARSGYQPCILHCSILRMRWLGVGVRLLDGLSSRFVVEFRVRRSPAVSSP